MADAKISQLPVATSSAGTDVLPIVQSSTTKQLAIENLVPQNLKSNATTGVLQVTGPAAGTTRVMTAPDANFTVARTDAAQSFTGDQTLATGNITQGTAAKGINFTANTPAAGKTSQLLNWYEEGTWTATISGSSTAGTVGYDNRRAEYIRIGNMVMVTVQLNIAVVTTAPTGNLIITGLPFTPKNPGGGSLGGGVYTGSANMDRIDFPAGTTSLCCQAYGGDTSIYIVASGNNVASAIVQANNLATDDNVQVSLCYIVS